MYVLFYQHSEHHTDLCPIAEVAANQASWIWHELEAEEELGPKTGHPVTLLQQRGTCGTFSWATWQLWWPLCSMCSTHRCPRVTGDDFACGYFRVLAHLPAPQTRPTFVVGIKSRPWWEMVGTAASAGL